MAVSPAKLFAEISNPNQPGPVAASMKCAVVLGASLAGLLAARVLSDHAEQVILIERDASETGSEPRPGVPQGTQVHVLLPAGVVQLERWFPGFSAEAVAAGAVVPPADGSRDRFFTNGVLRATPPAEHGLPVLFCTRPFLESWVRRRTLDTGNVKLVTGRAEGLVFEGDQVTGAGYVPHGASERVVRQADLVVDATGRSSKVGDWLAESGWPRPPVQRMPIKLNYATAKFAYDEKISEVWMASSQTTAEPATGRIARIGGFNRVEGDRWIMLIAGYGDDRPSRNPQDYITRCRKDFPDVFGDIAERAELLGDVVTYHQADSSRRDFHELTRFPAGLVVVGDAVASFNPVYGQGMTCAALHASCLSQYLRSRPSLAQPAKAYFDLVRVVVDAAWQISTFADLGLPHVEGPYPRFYRLINWCSGRLLKAATTDGVINEQLLRVTTMLAHPSSLAAPGILARALRVNLMQAITRR